MPDELTAHRVELAEAVRARLDQAVRPRLASHVGGIEVTDVDERGVIKLHFTGSCAHCPARATTAAMGVRPFIEHVPGVTGVEFDNVWISRHAQERLSAMARRTSHWVECGSFG